MDKEMKQVTERWNTLAKVIAVQKNGEGEGLSVFPFIQFHRVFFFFNEWAFFYEAGKKSR